MTVAPICYPDLPHSHQRGLLFGDVGMLHRHSPYPETAELGGAMKSGRISAGIGLAVGVGPAIAAYLMPRIGMLDQLSAVILGVIIGIQAASRRRTRYDKRGPDEAIKHAEPVAGGSRNSAAIRPLSSRGTCACSP
jgi:hypothetical protein